MSDTRPRAEHEAELRSNDQTGSVVTKTAAIARTVDPIGLTGTLELGVGPSATGGKVQSCTPTNDGPLPRLWSPKLQWGLRGRGGTWVCGTVQHEAKCLPTTGATW